MATKQGTTSMDAEKPIQLPATHMQNTSVGLPWQCTQLPSSQELAVYQAWAKTANESQMYKNTGKEAGIMMIMLAAREYNIAPAMALNGALKIINGQVELSARIMESLIRRQGHKIEIVELTDEKCTLKGTRKDTRETQTASFTLEQARKAGLVKDGGGWKKWTEDMLYARALSRLARRLFADIIGCGYVEGEISGIQEAQYEIIEPKEEVLPELVNILELIPQDQHAEFNRYLDSVVKHTKQPLEWVLNRCNQDPDKTIENFNKWMESK